MNDHATLIRTHVQRRMADLGIETFGDLAELAGVDRDTVGNVLAARTNPYPRTRAALARALQWPEDWLEHIARDETPPDLRDAAARVAAEQGATTSNASGGTWTEKPGDWTPDTWAEAFAIGARLADVVHDAGLRLLVATPDGTGMSGTVIRDGEPVAVIQVRVLRGTGLGRRLWENWRDSIMAARLRVSATHGDYVPVIAYLTGDGIPEELGQWDDAIDELVDVYKIPVVTDDDQLRRVLERL